MNTLNETLSKYIKEKKDVIGWQIGKRIKKRSISDYTFFFRIDYTNAVSCWQYDNDLEKLIKMVIKSYNNKGFYLAMLEQEKLIKQFLGDL